MRIASWSWGGRDHVGSLSPCGREVTPLAVADASRGALGLIQALSRGEAPPSPSGAQLPTGVVTLRAPLPKPLRNLLAVVIGRGGRDMSRSRAMDRATSSPPARRPAWAWASTRRAGCVRATWCASRSMASVPSRTGSSRWRCT